MRAGLLAICYYSINYSLFDVNSQHPIFQIAPELGPERLPNDYFESQTLQIVCLKDGTFLISYLYEKDAQIVDIRLEEPVVQELDLGN